jgi:hypothetical protein
MVKAKDRLTPEEWCELGNQFEVAAHALMEGRSQQAAVILGVPHVVLRAFGVEALLKCLIELDGHEAPKDHNLLRLFRKLDPRHRRVLRKRWRKEFGPKVRAWNAQKGKNSMVRRLPVGLDGILKLSGDAFLLFRYKPAQGVTGFVLMNFPLTIREYIVEMRPELKANLGNIRIRRETGLS